MQRFAIFLKTLNNSNNYLVDGFESWIAYIWPIKCLKLDALLRDEAGCMRHEIDAEKEEAASLTSRDGCTP